MDKKKKLNRMAIWLIAVFAAAFAIVLTVLYLASGYNLGMAFAYGWKLILIVAAICLVMYFVYKFYLDRKK